MKNMYIHVYSNKFTQYVQVIMGDKPAAERACKDPNPIIDGRKANVNLAILGAKPRGNLQTSKRILLFTKLIAVCQLILFSCCA